jgi:hypothetical protein
MNYLNLPSKELNKLADGLKDDFGLATPRVAKVMLDKSKYGVGLNLWKPLFRFWQVRGNKYEFVTIQNSECLTAVTKQQFSGWKKQKFLVEKIGRSWLYIIFAVKVFYLRAALKYDLIVPWR